MIEFMSILTEHTILPDTADAYRELGVMLSGGEIFVSRGTDTSRLPLDQALRGVLLEALSAFQQGEAVTVVPRTTLLTTQEAADVLGMSRPTLVHLLEDGEIPFEKPGRHRRVLLRDLLDYQARLRSRRSVLLDQLGEDAAERLNEEPDSFVRTR